MIPYDMTVIHDPDNGRHGDCFRCCIASILQIPPSFVPHFCDYDSEKEDKILWHARLIDFLRPIGLTYLEFNVDPTRAWNFIDIEVYHVISGQSANYAETRHSVVGRNGVPVHDPSPTRKFLAGPFSDSSMNDYGMYSYGFLIHSGVK